MKLNDAFKTAIDARDVAWIGRILDNLRFDHNATYAEIMALAHRLTGISAPDWEALMEELEMIESLKDQMEARP